MTSKFTKTTLVLNTITIMTFDLSSLAELSQTGNMGFHYGSHVMSGKTVVQTGYNQRTERMRDPITRALIPVSAKHSEQCAFSKFISGLSVRSGHGSGRCLL